MTHGYFDRKDREASVLSGDIPFLLREAMHDLSDDDPEKRERAVLYLLSATWDDDDITPALPHLERALTDSEPVVRTYAASSIEHYALVRYKVDIASHWPLLADNIQDADRAIRYPLVPYARSGEITLRKDQDGTDEEAMRTLRERAEAMRLFDVTAGDIIPLNYCPDNQILQIAYTPVSDDASFVSSAENFKARLLREGCGKEVYTPPQLIFEYVMTDRSKPSGVRQDERKVWECKGNWNSAEIEVSRHLFHLIALMAVIFAYIAIPNEVFTYMHNFGIERNFQEYADTPGVSEVNLNRQLMKPEYLSKAGKNRGRHIGTESSVFTVLKDIGKQHEQFIRWFHDLGEEQKRGFILYIRSRALAGLLGKKKTFMKDHWMGTRSENIGELTRKYLAKNELMHIAGEYRKISRRAERLRTIFLSNNDWLAPFLGINYSDFEKGLFYFLSEHTHSVRTILEESLLFSEKREMIIRVSEAIIRDRTMHTRISPKERVSDQQIREIVAAAFFTEVFYGVPADFITLISAYESNFSMEYWEGGYGTTQQTSRGASTVLHSDFWKEKVNASARVRLNMQMIPISALDNVFLCITEAGKTVALKAAELQIRTTEINPSRKISFAGREVPATWAIAFKYNGSRRNALSYANTFHRLLKERKWWLKSFNDAEQGTEA